MKIEYTHTFFYPNTLQRKRKKKKTYRGLECFYWKICMHTDKEGNNSLVKDNICLPQNVHSLCDIRIIICGKLPFQKL